ncbi:uncharacterized protein [Anabrus simplex]|uniref:uncharacterized protein n=1 Tax=Anabrus simplex TaxID=316456 RepID=UPI0035A283CD
MSPWLLRLLLMLIVYKVVRLQTHVSLIISLRRHFKAGCVFFSTGNSTGLDNSALYFEVQRILAQEGIPSQTIAPEDKGRVECRISPLFVLTVDDVNRFRGFGNFPDSSVQDRTVWLLLLLEDERLEEVLFGVDIPFDREFLVAEKCRSGNTISEVYRTSRSQPLQIFHYGNWSGPWPGLNLYERRRDLQGITLRATAMRTTILNDNSNRQMRGGVREIWNALEQQMNFTTNFIEPPDGAWGRRHGNGSWTGMIGQVQRGEVEVAVGMFTMTTERAATVHFSLPVHETKEVSCYLGEVNEVNKLQSQYAANQIDDLFSVVSNYVTKLQMIKMGTAECSRS